MRRSEKEPCKQRDAVSSLSKTMMLTYACMQVDKLQTFGERLLEPEFGVRYRNAFRMPPESSFREYFFLHVSIVTLER